MQNADLFYTTDSMDDSKKSSPGTPISVLAGKVLPPLPSDNPKQAKNGIVEKGIPGENAVPG